MESLQQHLLLGDWVDGATSHWTQCSEGLSSDADDLMSRVNMFHVDRLYQPLDLITAAPAASPSSL